MFFRKPFTGCLLFALLVSAACTAGGAGAPAATAVPTTAAAAATTAATLTASPPPAARTLPPTSLPTPSLSSATLLPAASPSPAGPENQEEGVAIQASDGLTITGTFRPGRGSAPWPALLLLHMVYGERGQWRDFAPQLAEAGYASLAIDLRGHGKTGGKLDWDLARDDLHRVWAYLLNRQDVDPQHTAILGASVGANLAIVTAADEPEVKAVVLLSPGLDYYGIKTEAAVEGYGPRPLLIAASQEDAYAASSSQKLASLAQGEVKLELYDQAGHGVEMLSRQPDLGPLILNWLKGVL